MTPQTSPAEICANCGHKKKFHKRMHTGMGDEMIDYCYHLISEGNTQIGCPCKKFRPKLDNHSQKEDKQSCPRSRTSLVESQLAESSLDKKPEVLPNISSGDLNSTMKQDEIEKIKQEVEESHGINSPKPFCQDCIEQAIQKGFQAGQKSLASQKDYYEYGLRKGKDEQKQKFLEAFGRMKNYFWDNWEKIPPELKEQARLTQINNIFIHAVQNFEDETELKSLVEKI